MLRRLSVKSQTPNQIFAKFLQFLDSAMWDIPISTFIEQKSGEFDRDNGNPEKHAEIHVEYTGLVDALIGCFCEDIGISGSQFSEALSILEKDKLSAKQRKTLDPVIASQDFDLFVRLMSQKNVELQLQALEMIEFMCGILPTLCSLDDLEQIRQKHELSTEEMDKIVLNAVMKRSKDEHDLLEQQELDADLEAIRHFSEAERRRLAEHQRLSEEFEAKASIKHDDKHEPSTTRAKTLGPVKKPPAPKPELSPKEDETEEAKHARTAQDVNERRGIASADVKARAEYLKAQRDKLLEMKKAERTKKLQAEEAVAGGRPKTARAARDALEGTKNEGQVDDDVIKARKALVEKLKKEVLLKE